MSAYHQSSLTIDPVDQLLGLRQGDRSIEDYVQQFCELVYQVPLYDETLFKDLFRFGLNEPVKSRLPGWEVNVRLSVFMDYALKLCDSPFTVGATEEERDAALTHEMTAAPKHAHKMAVTTTPRHVIATSHESSQVTTARRVRSPASPASSPQARARSVPGARRVRSRGRSVPGARRVRSRGRSVPGARRIRSPAGPAQLSFVSAGPAQLSFVSAGPAQLSFVSVGPAQLSFVSAGPAQLSFVSAGPAQLSFVSAGPAQLSFVSASPAQLAFSMDSV